MWVFVFWFRIFVVFGSGVGVVGKFCRCGIRGG